MNKKIILGIVVVVVVIVAGILYAFFGQGRVIDCCHGEQYELQNSPRADWKTYTNEKYEFEISYPGSPKEFPASDVSEYTLMFSANKPEETLFITMTPIDKFLPIGPDAVFYNKKTKEMVIFTSISKKVEIRRERSSVHRNNWSGFMIAGELFIVNEKSNFIIGLQINGMATDFSEKIINSIKLIK